VIGLTTNGGTQISLARRPASSGERLRPVRLVVHVGSARRWVRCRRGAPRSRGVTLSPGVAGSRQPAVEIEGRAAEGQVRERLWAVAEALRLRAQLLAVQPEVGGVAEHLPAARCPTGWTSRCARTPYVNILCPPRGRGHPCWAPAASTSRCSSSRVTRRPSWKAARNIAAVSRVAADRNAAPISRAVVIASSSPTNGLQRACQWRRHMAEPRQDRGSLSRRSGRLTGNRQGCRVRDDISALVPTLRHLALEFRRRRAGWERPTRHRTCRRRRHAVCDVQVLMNATTCDQGLDRSRSPRTAAT